MNNPIEFSIYFFMGASRSVSCTVVQQFYQTRVIDEFVLRGNAAVLKCNLPSFVADFVYVEAWIADDGTEILPNTDEFGTCIQRITCHSHANFIVQSINCVPNADFHKSNTHKLIQKLSTKYVSLHE